MCPGAEQLLGQLADSRAEPARVVALAFHVDYFNEPWKDPLSDHAFSVREMAYGRVQKRDDLYFTPMLMVDGRVPMLGTNAKLAQETIRQTLAEPPGLALDLSFGETDRNSPLRKSLKVTLRNPAKSVIGRSLVVGVATVEDRVTTRVESGENASKTLLNRFAVHSLVHRPAKLTRGVSAKLEVPIDLAAEWNPANTSVTVFAQDEQNGRVYQAGSVRWQGEPKGAAAGSVSSDRTPAR